MKYIFLFLLVNTVSLSCLAQQAGLITSEKLKARLKQQQDTIFVVNFWATWCSPCIKELPQFEKIKQVNFDRPVKVLLISMNDEKKALNAVNLFIHKHQLSNEVYLMDEASAKFIPGINKEWSGSLPATMIISGSGNRRFFNGALSYPELVAAIRAAKN